MGIYFTAYGRCLSYLSPMRFYREEWTYVGTAKGDDGKVYDIVRNITTWELRYTNV